MLSFALAQLILTTTPSYAQTLRRSLTEADGKTTYEVSRRAPTLYMISRDLYGTESHWAELAEWNHLEAPYKLSEGQRLQIETPASLGEAEADEAVAQAWTKLGNEVMATRIREQGRQPAVAADSAGPVVVAPSTETPSAASAAGEASATDTPPAEAPFESSLAAVVATPTPAPAVTPAPAPAPAPVAEATAVPAAPTAAATDPLVTAAPAPVLAPAPAPCVCAARPSPVPATALEDDNGTDGPTPAFRWQWRADLLASMYALDSTRTGGASETRLNSRLNYGLEVEALYRFTNQFGLGLVASSERVTINPPEGGRSFRQAAKDFARGGVIARTRPSEAYALHLGVAATERPYPLMTTRGMVLHSAIVPEFTAGADVPFVDAEWSAAMLIEGVYTSPTSDKYFDISSGYGVHAGVRVEIPHGPARLTAALRFRYFNQDTSDTRNNIRGGVLNLGVTW